MNKAVHDRHEVSLHKGGDLAEASFGYQATKGLANATENELRYQFMECRKELQNLQRIYQSCSKNSVGHSREATTLRGFRNEVDTKITILKKRSIYIVFKRAKECNFKHVDLHGLYLDEAQECVILVLDSVLKAMISQNTRKYISLTIGSHWKSSPVEVSTVKGNSLCLVPASRSSWRMKSTRSRPPRTTAI